MVRVLGTRFRHASLRVDGQRVLQSATFFPASNASCSGGMSCSNPPTIVASGAHTRLWSKPRNAMSCISGKSMADSISVRPFWLAPCDTVFFFWKLVFKHVNDGLKEHKLNDSVAQKQQEVDQKRMERKMPWWRIVHEDEGWMKFLMFDDWRWGKITYSFQMYMLIMQVCTHDDKYHVT